MNKFIIMMMLAVLCGCIKDDYCNTTIKGRLILTEHRIPMSNFKFTIASNSFDTTIITNPEGYFNFCFKDEVVIWGLKRAEFGDTSTYYYVHYPFSFMEPEKENDVEEIEVFPINFLKVELFDNPNIVSDSLIVDIRTRLTPGGSKRQYYAYNEKTLSSSKIIDCGYPYDSNVKVTQKQRLKGQTQFTTETNSYIIHPNIIQKHIIEY